MVAAGLKEAIKPTSSVSQEKSEKSRRGGYLNKLMERSTVLAKYRKMNSWGAYRGGNAIIIRKRQIGREGRGSPHIPKQKRAKQKKKAC